MIYIMFAYFQKTFHQIALGIIATSKELSSYLYVACRSIIIIINYNSNYIAFVVSQAKFSVITFELMK